MEGRKTGGRKAGVPNKANAKLKALAQKHTPEAIGELVGIMRSSESDAARVSAIKELLDRGYGKARQPITGDDEGNELVIRILDADA